MERLLFRVFVTLETMFLTRPIFIIIHLSDFFRRIAYRKGRQAAVSATARKLGVIIWTMITKKVPYKPPTEYLFLDQKRKMKMVTRIKKNIAKFDIKPEDVGFGNSLNLSCDF